MLLYNTYNQPMNFSRAAKFFHACLIVLMLLAQSAVAQHSTNHSWHDSSEYCQVFASAEASKLVFTPELTWNVNALPQAMVDVYFSQCLDVDKLTAFARGPPQAL